MSLQQYASFLAVGAWCNFSATSNRIHRGYFVSNKTDPEKKRKRKEAKAARRRNRR